MLSVVEVDLELDDDLGEEQYSYICHYQGVFKQFRRKNRELKHRRNSHQ